MKRGFLISSAPRTRPLAPSNSAKTTKPKQAYSYQKLPYGKVDEIPTVEFETLLSFERVPYNETTPDDGRFVFTTLPPGINVPESVECLFLSGAKAAVLATPGFPAPLPLKPSPAPFRVGSSEGKGQGLFAARDIKQGELILRERPLVITPRAFVRWRPQGMSDAQFTQFSLNENERALEIMLTRMTDEHRDALMNLFNSHTEDGSGPIMGRIRTNGIALTLVEGAEVGDSYSATCEFISRLNHSCSPNTSPKFHKASLSYSLYAVRDIPAGEELTFQYTNVVRTKAKRNEELKPYGFQCTCGVCSGDATAIALSDARRKAIASYSPGLAEWIVNRAVPDDWLIKKCTLWLGLIEQEQLQHLEMYCVAANVMMTTYICLGDTQRASEWARKVKQRPWSSVNEYRMKVDDFMHPQSSAFREHMLWRSRVDKDKWDAAHCWKDVVDANLKALQA